MYEQVETGQNYDKVAQLLATYRGLAARMANARARTQGKIDRRLEQLGERIGIALEELTYKERMALTCWKEGVIKGTYEVDVDEITAKPYVSIRRIDRWTEEHDLTVEYDNGDTQSVSNPTSEQLRAFLNKLE
jgi:nucleoside-triphosphatase THEP1